MDSLQHQKPFLRPPAADSEHGVILPLAAIIAGTLLFVLVALGIDTGLTKLVRSSAQEEIEEICQGGAEALPVTRTAVGNVVARLNHLRAAPPNGKGGIKFGEIIGFRIISPTAPANGTLKNGQPTLAGAPSAGPIGLAGLSCPLDNGLSCLFGGNVTHAGVATQYPAQFWNPEVPSALTQSSPENNLVYGDIIACEMTVRVRTFLRRNIEVNVKSAYDRAQRGALFPPQSTAVPPASARSQRGGGLLLGISTHMTTIRGSTRYQFKTTPAPRYALLRPFDPLRTVNRPIAFSGDRDGYDGTNRADISRYPLGSSEQLERMVACLNLPILVRNALLTRIVGFAARDSLRDRTEIMHIGTKLPSAPGTPVPPTVMFRGWGDIANNVLSSNGHIPFIWHPSAPSTFATTQQGSTLVGQLRDCEHMYDGKSDNFSRYIDRDVINTGFEPLTLSTMSGDPSIFTPAYLPAIGSGFGQWGRAATKSFANAEQVVSILGSTQSCPDGRGCSKPPMQTDTAQVPDELRADLTAFMRYARNVTGAQAYEAPGYGLAGPTFTNQSVFSTDAAILVVLHQRVTAAEAAAIRAQLPPNVAITVLYIPNDQYDASEPALVNLRTAFNAQSPGAATPTGNLLYTIAPKDCPAPSCAAATQAQWDDHFQSYWMGLLDPSAPQNIEQIGQTIYDRLTYIRLRL